MIRVATYEELEPKFLTDFLKLLYQAFGVGAEHSGNFNPPNSATEPFDAQQLLAEAPKVSAFQDDKILFLTGRTLKPRKLITGEVPTYGLTEYNGQRSVVTFAHVKNPYDNVRTVARYAMQEMGHAWGLHHCLDPRCAMYPHWTPSYAGADAQFCVFCRDASDQKIRLAKS